ncbi:MAG: adenosyl-hopene transferase HpnH [Candidatus Omnitrophota bacterium]
MRFNLGLTAKLAGHIISNKLKRNKRFSLVLMLEPTFKCNLSCEGCGRVREYKKDLDKTLSVKECLDAVDECDAKIVSICGGEPLVYPHIYELIEALTKKKAYIYLCTNGILFKEKMAKFKVHRNLMINFHLDGLERTHEAITGLSGAYAKVIDAIKAAKSEGFFVCTNTTIYQKTDPKEIKELFRNLDELGVDGFIVSPAYSYSGIEEGFFLKKRQLADFFGELESEFKKYNLLSSPLYIEFIQGKRDLNCSPWANPTRNPLGWRSPCYQLADNHFQTYRELIDKTDWSRYGPAGGDKRCKECAVHCGFEPTSVLDGASFKDILKLLRWQFF